MNQTEGQEFHPLCDVLEQHTGSCCVVVLYGNYTPAEGETSSGVERYVSICFWDLTAMVTGWSKPDSPAPTDN